MRRVHTKLCVARDQLMLQQTRFPLARNGGSRFNNLSLSRFSNSLVFFLQNATTTTAQSYFDFNTSPQTMTTTTTHAVRNVSSPNLYRDQEKEAAETLVSLSSQSCGNISETFRRAKQSSVNLPPRLRFKAAGKEKRMRQEQRESERGSNDADVANVSFLLINTASKKFL